MLSRCFFEQCVCDSLLALLLAYSKRPLRLGPSTVPLMLLLLAVAAAINTSSGWLCGKQHDKQLGPESNSGVTEIVSHS